MVDAPTLDDMMEYDAEFVLLNTNDVVLQNVDLQISASVSDELGSVTPVWSTHADGVMAQIIPRQAEIVDAGGKEVVETTHHLYGAYTQATAALAFTDVLKFQRGAATRELLRFKWLELGETRYFGIIRAVDLGEEHRWIRCEIVEREVGSWN